MTNKDELGLGEFLARKLVERSGFMREAGHDDDADLDIEAAAALTTLIAERDGLLGQVQRKQDLLDSFVSFVHRWAWVKEGNGTSDTERLDVIKHYPPVALHNATALHSKEGEKP